MIIYGVESSAFAPPRATIPPGTGNAVLVDETSFYNGLTVDTQTTSNSYYLTLSAWIKCDDPNRGVSNWPSIVSFAWNGSSGPSGNSYLQIGSNFNSDIYASLMLNTGNRLNFGSGDIFTNGSWHHIFMSVDTNHAAGAKIANLLLDGVDVKNGAYTSDTYSADPLGVYGSTFSVSDGDGSGHGVGNGALKYYDLWIAYEQYIAPADVTKFRTVDGHPVDLGYNGDIPTGTPPTYFFHGDSTTFATNAGTGDAVTLHGSLVDAIGPT